MVKIIELSLNERGREIVAKGGDDALDADAILINEIIARAPGISGPEVQKLFIMLMEQYGEDALRAIREGHVKFETIPLEKGD